MKNHILIAEEEETKIDLEKVKLINGEKNILLESAEHTYILDFKDLYKKEQCYKALQAYVKVAKDPKRWQAQRILLTPKMAKGRGKSKRIDFWEIEFIS